MKSFCVNSICLSNKILTFTAQNNKTSRIGGSHEPLTRASQTPFLLLQ